MAGIPGVGDQLGPYRITRQLGAGGMGVVFEAQDDALGRPVALKVLSLQLAGHPEFRARFAREATILARSDSPHIIQVYSHGEQDGCLYLATQFVSGGDIAARVEGEGLPPAHVAVDITAQVASALADAHAVGVIHRDVKPHNVLLRPGQGHVHAYLCDFGIARGDDASTTSTGAVAGTYAYLAPERFLGQPATPAADVYALGCLLWFMLAGQPPYGGNLAQLARQHESAEVPQMPGASYELNDFLRRSLAKDPAARPTAAESVGLLRTVRAGELPTVSFNSPEQPLPPVLSGPSAPPVSTAPVEPPTMARPAPPAYPMAAPVSTGSTPAYGSHGSYGSAVSGASVPPGGVPVAPAPRSRGNGLMILLAVLLAVVLGVTIGIVVHLVRRDAAQDPGAGGTVAVDGDASATVKAPGAGEAPDVDTSAHGPGPVSGPVASSDVDGDGFGDTILVDNAGDRTLVLASDPDSDTGFGDLRVWSDSAYGSAKVVTGDFTGDGWADLALIERDQVRVARSHGTGFGAPERWIRVDLPEAFQVAVGDFDGDDVADLALVTGQAADYVDIDVALSAGDAFDAPARWAHVLRWELANMKVAAGDLTGDGKADFFELGQPDGGGSDIRVFPSTGDGFSRNEGWYFADDWNWDDVRITAGDVDGDGDADAVVMLNGGAPRVLALRSDDGALVSDPEDVEVEGLRWADQRFTAPDVDGDGSADLMLWDRSTAQARLLRYVDDGLQSVGGVSADLSGDHVIVVGLSR